ncbi:unnamed protein product [Plutella xylostella]|uniref:(diamondback moth) hypothetical protein n=1 Tax=Plutella xylostella TaxID=51655 RepID=A0A8S4EJU4_PLUXY|nr:unnamed protein product [Plutella xylostella]
MSPLAEAALNECLAVEKQFLFHDDLRHPLFNTLYNPTGPPKILSNRTQFGSPGAAVRLECAALAVPRVDSIVWTYRGQEIDTIHDQVNSAAVRLKCAALAVPRVDSIVWTFRGQEIDTIHDQEYTFQEDLQPGGVVNSSLIIRDSQARHFGVYRCNVSNEYGSDCVDIVLTPHKTFPLLLVSFATVSAAVMLLITLALLLVLCQRKQRKNKLAQTVKKPDVTVTAEEFFKEDRNSNISDLKLELAHGNGHCEVDYSNTGSDSTLCSNAKLGGGVPLAGTVPLPSLQSKTYQSYRFSNDYSDPAYADCYKPNGYGNGYQTFGHFGHDYTPGSLRVTSPTAGDKLTPNRSVNGSLPRSMDSGSVVQFTQGNNSQTNSLKRALGVKALDSSHDLNSVSSNGDVPRLGNGALSRIDVRYAATYGNPHLRSGTALGFSQVNTAKPASTPAPPPYSSIRSSVVLPSGETQLYFSGRVFDP